MEAQSAIISDLASVDALSGPMYLTSPEDSAIDNVKEKDLAADNIPSKNNGTQDRGRKNVFLEARDRKQWNKERGRKFPRYFQVKHRHIDLLTRSIVNDLGSPITYSYQASTALKTRNNDDLHEHWAWRYGQAESRGGTC